MVLFLKYWYIPNMKTKPLLIGISIVIVLVSTFFIVKNQFKVGPEKNGVRQFLVAFNKQLGAGNTDSVKSYFELNQKAAVLNRLISVLTNKTGLKGDELPLFKLTLSIDSVSIKILTKEIAEADIPVKFANDTLGSKATFLKLRVRKVSGKGYRIVQVDASKLMSDYLAFTNFIKSKTLTDKDIYSELTLKAFETAKHLKGKYDTVIWFSHLGDSTYYYVVNGNWDQDLVVYRRNDTVVGPYQMGLVGPNLKVVIPPQFDMVHTINATFPSLIEVEKGNKKGFYDLNGKNVVPVNFEQIFPINDDNNIAVLRNGDDFFYLKKDLTITAKVDLKFGDFLLKIRDLGNQVNLYSKALNVVTEYNSRRNDGAVYIAPSYLVDLNMISIAENFKNPLRKVAYDNVNANYNIGFLTQVKDESNWITASFYSVRDYFLGGRSEFYDKRNLVIVDKKKNKVYSSDIGINYVREEDDGASLDGVCDIKSIKVLNDSLYEVKSGAVLWANLYDSTKTLTGGPYYHYMAVKNNKLVELPNQRYFGFTKYIKMDDTYLNNCYRLMVGKTYHVGQEQTIDHITPEILRYMKNEIYADYGYKFKDSRWQRVFEDMPAYGYDPNSQKPKESNVSVDDSLTETDKYNINWINQKLKGTKNNTIASK